MSSPTPKPEPLQEYIALPDAPGDPPIEEEGADLTSKHDTEIPGAEPETPRTEPAEPASPLASVKKEEIADLENLFTDDDYEEDFMEDIDDADILASEVGTVSIGPSIDHLGPEVMLVFYQRLFPFDLLYRWLHHPKSKETPDFDYREFAFTLHNDAYLRYQSFFNAEAFRKGVLSQNPSRFEIGPVYSANPRDRKKLLKPLKPVSKELVFDIDLTDYDDIRTCCGKANICHKCWNFVTAAIKVIDVALKEDLGFKHVLWVYSGRRGAHAWVCDESARTLDDAKRKAVAGYLEVVRGNAQAGKKVNLKRPLHPHIERSLGILAESFESVILAEQDPWRDTEGAEALLRMLPDKGLCDALRRKWDSDDNRSSVRKWKDIADVGATCLSKTFERDHIRIFREDVVIECMYPRLDVEVSKHLNHLLKSPFCVHPGTGRVCVPIKSEDLEAFDPMTVPTVNQLLNEINEFQPNPTANTRKNQGFGKTSLEPYIDYFRSFVSRLTKEMGIKSERGGKSSSSMEF